MAMTKIRGNTQILDLSINNAQIADKGTGNEVGIELVKIQDGELLVKSDGSVAFNAPVAGVTPVAPADLATKSYVDATAQGLDVKLSVRAVSTTDIALSGLQTVDGVALVEGDRILVAGQDSNVANGIYVVHAGGWLRSADATTNTDVTPGLFTFVEAGDTNAGTGWVLTSVAPTVLGTTPLPFTQFSTAGVLQAGNGLVKQGNVIDVISHTAAISSTPAGLDLVLDGSTLAVTTEGLKLADLAEGSILIGSATGVATAQAVSGAITIDAAGVTSLTPGAVSGDTIADGSLDLSKLAGGTAGQLIAAGADGKPAYVDVHGDATLAADGTFTLGANSVNTAEIADGSVTLAKLATIPAGQLIMGSGDGNVAVTLSGDVTIDEAGVVTINPATVARVQDMITREVPTGIINGVNDTFSLANPARVGTESVYVNGLLQDSGAGNDYTIDGATITMLYALTAGDKLRVSYVK